VANTAIGFGLTLVVLGVVGYVASGGASITALIPAFFGLPLAGLGWLARNDRYRKHAMHGAAAIALLGLLGTARGLVGLGTLLAGGTVARPAAVIVQAAMAAICGIFLALAVKSFVAARRARA